MTRSLTGVAAGLALALACGEKESAPLFEKVPVTRTTIVVSASAAGVIEPVRTVDVKSKASGEIIELHIETGAGVRAGQLLAVVDPRQPRNNLSQAEADLEVARAQLEITKTKFDRATTLFKSRTITESEYEDARLSYVSANAQVVRAQIDLEIARDQMDDTRIVASVDGVVIAKNVELGTVISSPTRDVGGGTVLFTMANLDTVQIRTMVDETDIGNVRPGLTATITVDAYPTRSFSGRVLKIEPQATVEQNVTLFPALVRIANPGHALMPGMNAEVEIHIGGREDVLAVPYASLRTARDVASAAGVLGLDAAAVEANLAAARKPGVADSARAPGDSTAKASPAERRGGRGARGGGSFIVFLLRDGRPTPAMIRTGLTDLDYMEVLDGLAEGDTVVVLPSASLVASQQRLQERIQRMTGGGIPGMQQQGSQTTPPRRQP
ncbi:MAG TPA: efflux RND transporter periplasmic adaptor subunit [Candidatus Krumholzibacteria bacterium]|nr:efflux RND transporter periplasmic adaptor subunit [Candidatus Krumholzibacteria bacterium]